MPIYFISHALRGPEINYSPMEKLVLALVHATRRLKSYFQEHTVVVVQISQSSKSYPNQRCLEDYRNGASN